MRAQIKVVDLPNAPCYTIAAEEFLILGRGKNADVVLGDDTAISRLHCKIFTAQKQFWVEDLGSRNRTLVNNRPIRKQPLKDGDRIVIGRYRLEFYILDTEAEEQDHEVAFERLKRQEKLISKIAVNLGFVSRADVQKCANLQKSLSEEGPYIDIEQILIDEGFINTEQLKKVYKHKNTIPFNIPGYKLQELIGFGGMGRIYKGRREDTQEVIAVKILSDVPQEQKILVGQRFIKEAKVIAKLNHPNIVAGLDFGFVDGNVYIVMEYIDGPTLQQEIKDRGGRLLADEALRIVTELTKSLEHAHKIGLVHRDIKPENVLLTSTKQVKLCDFGLVKDQNALEKEEHTFGTPAYMSPEQCRLEKDVDIRSDIYSLGVLFYRILFGRLPFVGTQQQIRKQHVTRTLKFPNEGTHLQKMQLTKIIRKMMAKDPQDRYQNPQDLLKSLKMVTNTFESIEIDGTQEVSVNKKTASVLSGLAATEELLVENKAPVFSLAATEIRLSNNSPKQPITAQEPPVVRKKPRWGVILTAIAIGSTLLSVWFFSKSTINREYDVVAQSIVSDLEEAESLYHDFSRKYPNTSQQDKLCKSLQQLLYKKAVRAVEDKKLLEATALCSKVTGLQQQTSEAEKAKALLQKISKIGKALRNKQEFWKLWKEIGTAIENNQIAKAQIKLATLKEKSRLREQKLEYQKLEKLLQQKIREQELQKFKFVSAYELKLKTSQENYLSERNKIRELLIDKFKPTLFYNRFKIPGVFLAATKNSLYCFDNDTGSILWSHKIAGESLVFMPLADYEPTRDMANVESVLVTSIGQKKLWLFSANGTLLWRRTMPQKILSPPIVYEQNIFVATEGNYCYQLLSYSGKILGGFTTGETIRNCFVNSEENLLYVVTSQFSYCFTLGTGEIKERVKTVTIWSIVRRSINFWCKSIRSPIIFRFVFLQRKIKENFVSQENSLVHPQKQTPN